MKIKRYLLAAAITMAAAACSGDVTAPDSALRADEAAASTQESTTTTTTPTPTVEPTEPTDPTKDGGHLGSGVGR